MPHLIVEITPNLKESVDALGAAMQQALIANCT